MSLQYRIGDVFERMAEIPDGSIDLIVTSPPFLALRSYLPADHPDKGREIGSEATPAAFLDTLLALTAEWGRVLAPHGSLCVELGDTYSGSSNDGGPMATPDRPTNGVRWRERLEGATINEQPRKGAGWPLAKSLTGIPTLYPWSLAYGRNLLTGQPSPAGQWRIRNVIVWARPNPPVAALGDKFRPATSYITVACRGARRYFDLDAVRTEQTTATDKAVYKIVDGIDPRESKASSGLNPAGAPPLDWHTDNHPEDGDWLWRMPTQPYAGSHYATFPMALPKRLIEAMCPLRVCTVCGRPSERIVEVEYVGAKSGKPYEPHVWQSAIGDRAAHSNKAPDEGARVVPLTTGWSECDCPEFCDTCGGAPCLYNPPHKMRHKWRTGVVLDPFAGSGTTLEAAQAVGRHAIGIDLDEKNADLARSRCGMFLETRDADQPTDNGEIPGQMEMFG